VRPYTRVSNIGKKLFTCSLVPRRRKTMRGFLGAERCCCTKQLNEWNVLVLGVECTRVSGGMADADCHISNMRLVSECGICPL